MHVLQFVSKRAGPIIPLGKTTLAHAFCDDYRGNHVDACCTNVMVTECADELFFHGSSRLISPFLRCGLATWSHPYRARAIAGVPAHPLSQACGTTTSLHQQRYIYAGPCRRTCRKLCVFVTTTSHVVPGDLNSCSLRFTMPECGGYA